MNEIRQPRCGFVAILGAPNAGKSTLVNHLVGSKVSIVTPKAQTTRTRILGITLKESSQIILIDTPGIFTPKRELERAMVKAAWRASLKADFLCVIIDAQDKHQEKSQAILDQIAKTKKIPIIILNKIDLLNRENLLSITEKFTQNRLIREVFMISARTGDGVAELLSYLAENLPLHPWLFPSDQITDMPQRFLAAEITREKIFLSLHQELPYSVTVHTDSWQEFKNGSVKISQTIYVLRQSQKAIVLGKEGQKIKAIGQLARKELNTVFERPVHLFVHVKVKENWAENPKLYQELGLNYNA
jgi:GTP-binding protein Era